MSIPDNELDLDKLFLPAWAQEPASANLYAKYEGGDGPRERGRDRDRRGPRPPGRGGPPGGRSDRGPRPQGRHDGPGRRNDRPAGAPGTGALAGAPAGFGPGGDRGRDRGPRGGRGGDR